MQNLESSLEALANRVAELEAQNRRLKKAGIVSFIVAAVVIAMGQAKPSQNSGDDLLNTTKIETQNILLKDLAG